MTERIAGSGNQSPRLDGDGLQPGLFPLGDAGNPGVERVSGPASGCSGLQEVSGTTSDHGHTADTSKRSAQTQAHVVYRFFDESDRLLYVGLSCRFPKRVSQHRKEKDWWPQIARIELQHVGSRDEARRVEAKAIRTERPYFNIALNGGGAAEGEVWVCPNCGSEDVYRLTWGAWLEPIASTPADGPKVEFSEDFGDFDVLSPNNPENGPHVVCFGCWDYLDGMDVGPWPWLKEER